MLQTFARTLRQRSRRRRYRQIDDILNVESRQGLILDLGGGPASFFAQYFPQSEHVILLEIRIDAAQRAKQKMPLLNVVVADGSNIPFAKNAIDVVVCNSVIEHVERAEALAAEIRRVGQSYFVQTPNDRFPLETHSFIPIPFYNMIPWLWLRRLMCKVFRGNFEYIDSVRYLSEHMLRDLFPEATLEYEKAFGLTKSFYIYFRTDDAI